MTPFGISAPISRNFFGFLRKSTISSSSCLASFAPATSLKVTFWVASFGSIMRALLLPKLSACIPGPFTLRVKNQMMIPRNNNGKINGAKLPSQKAKPVSRCTSIVTADSCSAVTPRLASDSEIAASVSRLASPGVRVSSVYAISSVLPRTTISLTSPSFTCCTTSEIESCSGSTVVSVRYENAKVIKISNNTVESILFQKLPGPTGTRLRMLFIASRLKEPGLVGAFLGFSSGFVAVSRSDVSLLEVSSVCSGACGSTGLLFCGFFSGSDIVGQLYRKRTVLRVILPVRELQAL